MPKFTIYPILGAKTSVPSDDKSLFVPMADGFATHDTGGQNFDLVESRMSCSKIAGYEAITQTAGASVTAEGIFEFTDASGVSKTCAFFDGVLYSFTVATSAAAITERNPTLVTAFDYYPAVGAIQPLQFSAITFAGYLVFTCMNGALTPYKWSGGASDATKLIAAGGTEYCFRYLEEYRQRVFGAFSDQSNGGFEVRYTNVIPAFASLEFPAANQLYKSGTDLITGIKRLGDTCIVYGENSINEIVYYPSSYLAPFGIIEVVRERGPIGPIHQGMLIATPENHYFYSRDYGFVRYGGGQDYEVISADISDTVDGIYHDYEQLICGTYVAPNKLIWAVPLAGASALNALLEYDLQNKQWQKRTLSKTPTILGTMRTKKISGSTYHRVNHLVIGATDGIVYADNEDINAAAGSDIDGYRIEPIMDFGEPFGQKFLSEIRFGIVRGGNHSLDISWRGGDTVKEVEAASWTALDSLSLNSPATPAIFPGQTARLHQIKWGTNLKDEKYEINRIDFIWTLSGV